MQTEFDKIEPNPEKHQIITKVRERYFAANPCLIRFGSVRFGLRILNFDCL
jgi:hypothetical protein